MSGLAPGGVSLSLSFPSFPYPIERVSGDQCEAALDRLAVGGVVPVIVGDDHGLERMLEQLPPSPRVTADTLNRAATIRWPQDHLHRVGRDSAKVRLALRRPLLSTLFPRAMREPNAEEIAACMPVVDAPVGRWPKEPERLDASYATLKLRAGLGSGLVNVALLPIAETAAAPAYLGFGGFNACPAAEFHVAFLRSLSERFGAQLATCTGDVLEVRVASGPQSRKEAVDLAREIYLYCPDTVDQGAGNLSNLAASLMASRWWHFWWD